MKLSVTLGVAPSVVRNWPRKDIIDLIAYDQLEPFGAWRDNWHSAIIANLLCQIYKKKGAQVPPIEAFMYKHPDDKKQQNLDSFIAMLDLKANGNRKK